MNSTTSKLCRAVCLFWDMSTWPGAGGYLKRTARRTWERVLATGCAAAGAGEPGSLREPRVLPSPRRPTPSQAGFPWTEVLKSKPQNYSGEKGGRKMVKSNKGAGRKSTETKCSRPAGGDEPPPGSNSVPSRHLVAVPRHCSTRCRRWSGRGDVSGDGAQEKTSPTSQRMTRAETLTRTPDPSPWKRVFVLIRNAVQLKNRCVSRSPCRFTEVGIEYSPAPRNFLKRIRMCSTWLKSPSGKAGSRVVKTMCYFCFWHSPEAKHSSSFEEERAGMRLHGFIGQDALPRGGTPSFTLS